MSSFENFCKSNSPLKRITWFLYISCIEIVWSDKICILFSCRIFRGSRVHWLTWTVLVVSPSFPALPSTWQAGLTTLARPVGRSSLRSPQVAFRCGRGQTAGGGCSGYAGSEGWTHTPCSCASMEYVRTCMVQGYVYMYNYIDSQGDPLLPPPPPPPPKKVKATKMKASIIYHQ